MHAMQLFCKVALHSSHSQVCVFVCDTQRDKKGEKFIFSKCWCRCCVSALKLGICSKACIEVGMHLMTLTVVILTMMMTAVVILTMMKMVIRTMMVPPVPTVSCMCSTHSAGLCRGMLSGETESSKKGKVKAGQLFALVKQSKYENTKLLQAESFSLSRSGIPLDLGHGHCL